MMRSDDYLPQRGDIVWINLDPRAGHEQSGHRPALVLSSQVMASSTNMAIVCSITNKARGLDYEVVLRGTDTQGVVLVPQVRNIDFRHRKVRFIEKVPPSLVNEVSRKVGLIIGA